MIRIKTTKMAEAVRPKQKHRKQKVKIKVPQEVEADDHVFSETTKVEDETEDQVSKELGHTTKFVSEKRECNQTEEGNVLEVDPPPSLEINAKEASTNETINEENLCREEQNVEAHDTKTSSTDGCEKSEDCKSEALENSGSTRPSSSSSYTSILQGGPAVVEDPDTPMARATSPAVSRTLSDEPRSPLPSIQEPIVVEEKSPHLLAEEAFARMQVLAENLRVSAEEAKKKKEEEEKSEVVEGSTTKADDTSVSHRENKNLIVEQEAVSVQEVQEPPRSSVKSPSRLEVPKTKIRAMSLSELLELYHNPQLAYSQQFIEDFIQNEMKKEGHEFFEILSNYLRARLQLVSVEEEIGLLQTSYNTLQEAIWITTTKSILVQGECGDKAKVTASHTYEQCQLDRDAVKQMEGTLKKIREQITNDLSLFAYSSAISKLQVESYIHDLYMDSPLLRDIPKNAPVQAQSQYLADQEGMRQIIRLKDCISILFMFHRKPVADNEFVKNIRSWTTRLVSSLLRVATFRDHLFVLNHLLRCPSGVGKWAADHVQFTKISPVSASSQGRSSQPSFSNDVLDHVITALSTVLLPVKAREDFLSQMRVNLSQESIQEEKTWILVDSDGEEDEEPSNAWLYLHENDVVAILNQFSLSDLFSHILLSTVSESGHVDYDIRRCTEPIMMKLLSFATVLVQLFGSGLRTYNMVRYRQLNKRIGRLIRHTISFVSDHWLNFQTHYGPMTTTTSMDTLQKEFDQLFMRATYCILTAQKLGSWQFMADMPYTCVSEGAMWQLLWILHQGQGQVINLDFLPPAQECKDYLQDPDSWQQLADNLTHMPTSEAFFLMTTFANMACCRSYSEQDFVQTITYEVFEIAYISTHTRDFCSKMGRELLSSIILTHPSALSFLLTRVKEVMSKLGKMALYLFSELPVGVWQPTDPDMLILRQWLLNFSIPFVENQLARTILSKVNWDVFEQTGRPVVDIRLHRQTALLLVEAYTRYISDKRAGFFITEGMKQMASYMTSTPSPEQVFNNWAWDLALKLKLHQQSVIWQASSQVVDPNFQPPSLSHETWLLPVMKGSVGTPTNAAKVPIACYIALAMTDVGHDVTVIMRDGLDLLNHLALSGQYTTSIHVLGCMVPLFLESPQYLLDNDLFLQVLQSLVVADESLLKSTKSAVMSVEFPGVIIRQLNEMIQAQISSHLMGPKADLLLTFWFTTIFKVSRYFMDRNCCYIANSLAQWCFVKKGVTDIYMKIGKDCFTQFCAACKDNQNVMSAVISWISSSQTVSPSFLDSPAIPEFPWLAFLLMLVEGEREGETGLWYAVQMNLQANPRLSVDAALKSAVSSLHLQQAPPSYKLLIYRWAKQALDTPMDHPLLPILWQRFFALYLGRQASMNNMSQRASVGERFFESMSNSGTLKKMRKRLRETSDYHLNFDPKKKSSPGNEGRRPASQFDETSSGGAVGGASTPSSPSDDSNVVEYTSTKEFHLMLAKLYQTYLLWLEEPRLHDANLYLPALPPQYEASRLNLVFQGYMGPWLEFVDTEGVQYTLSCLAVDWRNRLTDARSPTQSLPDRNSMSEPANATKRIEQRLKRYDPPKDPPALCKVQTAVPLVSPSIVVDKDAFLQLVSSDLELLRQHTLIFSAKNANHSALDGVYTQLLPYLYSNVNKVLQLTAECRSTLNPLHKCSLPAVIPIRINQKEMNEITFRRIQENRVEYKQLMIEMLVPTPLNICVAAVHTENAITCLIKQCQKSSNASQKQRLRDIGCTLFFQLTSLVSEDTNFYPPARHFFASCIEILGQEFVSEDRYQTETVLQLCLDKPLVSGLVSPHFIPNSCPDRVVDMYGQLIHVLQEQNMDLVFMLLTKFDISLWLEQHRPVEAERKRLIEILGSSLTACGQNPESSMVFGLYVAHLKALLRSNFPSNMSCILNMMLQGSATNCLNVQVWETFLAVCFSGDPLNSTNFDPVNMEGCNEVTLSTAQVKDYLDWMGSYFMHARITACQSSDGAGMKAAGLHSAWASYAYYIGLFLGGLVRSYGAKILRVSEDVAAPFQILNCVWNAYAPWIQPMVGDNDALNTPWTETDGLAAAHIISSLSSSLSFIHQQIISHTPDRAPGLLSLILMYYMTALCTKTTPPHAMTGYLQALERLPWESLWPDLQLVEAMTKVKETASPCCFSLIGHILPFIKWDAVNRYHIQQTPPDIASRMQTGIALLHIQAYVDPDMLKRDGIYRLLMEAESFDWSAISMDGITCVTSWFLQLGDPVCVLAERSSRLAIGLRVLKQLCAFTSHHVQWQEHMTAKRHMYVHVMTQQFCQLTYKQGTTRAAVNTALINLLSEIEAVESSVPSVEGQREESSSLLKSVCGLLNNSNPDGVWLDAILATITGWLQSSPQSNLLAPCMRAASTSLASLRHMVVVMEACVASYFSGLSSPTASSSASTGWNFILSIFHFPELNPAGFMQEALAENAFLVLYAYFRYKVPFCQTTTELFALVNEIFRCCQKATPSAEDEMKVLLWWHLLLDLLIHHFRHTHSPGTEVANTVNRFVPYLNAMGQDRNNKGLLGAIGFGQKSSLSKRMRLMSVVVSSFLQTQMTSSSHVRVDARLPLPSASVPKELRNIRAAKSYAPLSAQCDKAIVFMRDPSRTFLDAPAFVSAIGQEMFPDISFLQHAFCQHNL